ncbi:hypothetical protein TSUD_128410 [Trifolium subterraneum]|uniref:Uncharacterized protein n=1 Tax=Trifolium subterraneum TaxID=3900 RepID=A0A2Z6N3M3_TRISU|nr:hypothetical protein TSUD_128410 [Trifolium subterraneum]
MKDRIGLEALFLEEDVVEIIAQSDGNKRPRSDNFNFKNFLGTIKQEVMEFFFSIVSRKINSPFFLISSYFIALIPKVLKGSQPTCRAI